MSDLTLASNKESIKTIGLVSVIIPLYNRLDYIDETIQSVLSQDYKNIELIVIDDGSTDGSYERAKAYADDNKLTLLTHENRANKGQSVAINVGLKYIAILDSDDMFAEGKVKRQVEYLGNNLDVGLVYGKGLAISATGEKLYETLSENHIENSDPNVILLDCYIAIPGGTLVRKTVFDDVGFFEESFRAAQDHDMALRLFETTKVAYLPEIAFYYRKHEGAISNNGLETRWRAGFTILKNAKARYPYKPQTIRKRRAVLNFQLAKTLFKGMGKSKTHLVEACCRIILAGLLDPIRSFKVITGLEKND